MQSHSTPGAQGLRHVEQFIDTINSELLKPNPNKTLVRSLLEKPATLALYIGKKVKVGTLQESDFYQLSFEKVVLHFKLMLKAGQIDIAFSIWNHNTNLQYWACGKKSATIDFVEITFPELLEIFYQLINHENPHDQFNTNNMVTSLVGHPLLNPWLKNKQVAFSSPQNPARLQSISFEEANLLFVNCIKKKIFWLATQLWDYIPAISKWYFSQLVNSREIPENEIKDFFQLLLTRKNNTLLTALWKNNYRLHNIVLADIALIKKTFHESTQKTEGFFQLFLDCISDKNILILLLKEDALTKQRTAFYKKRQMISNRLNSLDNSLPPPPTQQLQVRSGISKAMHGRITEQVVLKQTSSFLQAIHSGNADRISHLISEFSYLANFLHGQRIVINENNYVKIPDEESLELFTKLISVNKKLAAEMWTKRANLKTWHYQELNSVILKNLHLLLMHNLPAIACDILDNNQGLKILLMGECAKVASQTISCNLGAIIATFELAIKAKADSIVNFLWENNVQLQQSYFDLTHRPLPHLLSIYSLLQANYFAIAQTIQEQNAFISVMESPIPLFPTLSRLGSLNYYLINKSAWLILQTLINAKEIVVEGILEFQQENIYRSLYTSYTRVIIKNRIAYNNLLDQLYTFAPQTQASPQIDPSTEETTLAPFINESPVWHEYSSLAHEMSPLYEFDTANEVPAQDELKDFDALFSANELAINNSELEEFESFLKEPMEESNNNKRSSSTLYGHDYGYESYQFPTFQDNQPIKPYWPVVTDTEDSVSSKRKKT